MLLNPLRSLQSWLATQRERSADWHGAWDSPTSLRQGTCTEFQKACEGVLHEVLRSRGLELEARRERVVEDPGPERSIMIVAEIPELDAEVWLHWDQAQVRTPATFFRLEKQDADTPAVYLDRLRSFLKELPKQEVARED